MFSLLIHTYTRVVVYSRSRSEGLLLLLQRLKRRRTRKRKRKKKVTFDLFFSSSAAAMETIDTSTAADRTTSDQQQHRLTFPLEGRHRRRRSLEWEEGLLSTCCNLHGNNNFLL